MCKVIMQNTCFLFVTSRHAFGYKPRIDRHCMLASMHRRRVQSVVVHVAVPACAFHAECNIHQGKGTRCTRCHLTIMHDDLLLLGKLACTLSGSTLQCNHAPIPSVGCSCVAVHGAPHSVCSCDCLLPPCLPAPLCTDFVSLFERCVYVASSKIRLHITSLHLHLSYVSKHALWLFCSINLPIEAQPAILPTAVGTSVKM